MDLAALISFLLLIVSWMALPASNGRVVDEEAPYIRTRTVAAEA